MGAKYNFTIEGDSLVMRRTPIDGDTQEKSISFKSPSLVEDNNRIKLYESGNFQTSLRFVDFGLIDEVAPSNIQDATDKLLALIGTISGGSVGSFIPLTGTEVDSPITGDLEMLGESNDLKIFNRYYDGGEDVLNENKLQFGDVSIGLLSENDNSEQVSITANSESGNISANSTVPGSRGIIGIQDFSQNITDLDYPQKIYVDGSTQRTTATSGSFTPTDTPSNLIVIHEAGATTTLTINLPTAPRDKQQVTIMSVGGIVGLTIATAVGTIVGTVTSLTALGSVKFVWLESESKWYKI